MHRLRGQNCQGWTLGVGDGTGALQVQTWWSRRAGITSGKFARAWWDVILLHGTEPEQPALTIHWSRQVWKLILDFEFKMQPGLLFVIPNFTIEQYKHYEMLPIFTSVLCMSCLRNCIVALAHLEALALYRTPALSDGVSWSLQNRRHVSSESTLGRTSERTWERLPNISADFVVFQRLTQPATCVSPLQLAAAT